MRMCELYRSWDRLAGARDCDEPGGSVETLGIIAYPAGDRYRSKAGFPIRLTDQVSSASPLGRPVRGDALCDQVDDRHFEPGEPIPEKVKNVNRFTSYVVFDHPGAG